MKSQNRHQNVHSSGNTNILNRNIHIPRKEPIFRFGPHERSALYGERVLNEQSAAMAQALREKKKTLFITLGLGVMSAVLYSLMFHFDSQLRAFAAATQQGHKAYFLVPIAIAAVFTLVHGTFTDRFFDAIGFKPGKK